MPSTGAVPYYVAICAAQCGTVLRFQVSPPTNSPNGPLSTPEQELRDRGWVISTDGQREYCSKTCARDKGDATAW
jgi:hypothetical protein